jgi:hypothetical protein
MELRVRGLTRAELDRIDQLAGNRSMPRDEYAKWLLLSQHQAPMTETELHQLLAQKARGGNMRAMELLARGMPAPVTGEVVADVPATGPESPFAEVVEDDGTAARVSAVVGLPQGDRPPLASWTTRKTAGAVRPPVGR